MPHGLPCRLAGAVLLLGLPTVALAQAKPADLPTMQTAPLPAGDASLPPRTGRYTMVPAEGGFVRLDTETGVVSQCRRETPGPDAGWRCAAIPENVLTKPDRTAELADAVEQISREVAELRARLDALDRPAVPGTAEQHLSDEEFNRSLDFSEEVIRRFFGLVREMKRGEPADRT